MARLVDSLSGSYSILERPELTITAHSVLLLCRVSQLALQPTRVSRMDGSGTLKIHPRLLGFYAPYTHSFPLREEPSLINAFEAVYPPAPIVKGLICIGHAMEGIDI